MLPSWIIEQRKERQRRQDEESWHRQPRVEAPRPHQREQPPHHPNRESERGEANIDFTL